MRSSEQAARLVAVVAAGACALVGSAAGGGGAAGGAVVGRITRVVSSQVFLQGRVLPVGRRDQPLYARDLLSVDRHGNVEFSVTLQRKKMSCFSKRRGRLRFSPEADVAINFLRGSTFCKTPPRHGGRYKSRTPGTNLDFTDPVFEVVVAGRRTVVKVRRGLIVVSGRAVDSAGVVVGRNQQTSVAAGADPAAATPIRLGAAEKKDFNQIERGLPPVSDTRGPQTALAPLRDPSSLRFAVLSFTASEAGATFSCALDDEPFRLCTSGIRYDDLPPGRHTATVRATDAMGNTGPAATTSWTVDGSLIAFTSTRDGNREIYTIDPSGNHLARLTDTGAEDADPAWSPDRSRIAFHSGRDGNAEIYVMNADGSGQTRLTRDQANDRNPDWSPDGRRIVFENDAAGTRELYVMNADGSGRTRLTDNRADDFDPAWSPDGKRIAFASTRDGNYEIYVMNADGTNAIRLTNTPKVEFNPSWSPDGKTIAFHSDRDGVAAHIYVMNADGSDQRPITSASVDDYNPSWAPDGAEVVFQRLQGGHTELYIVPATGGETARVTASPADDLVPDW